MCGIAGVFHYASEQAVSAELLKQMTDVIAHRGPDDVVFLAAIPKTSVGKFDKKVLRVQFENHELAT